MQNNKTVELLLEKNISFSEKFSNNPMVQLAAGKKIQDTQVRERLLDAIQVLSNYFQKVIMLRHVFCADKAVSKITFAHLAEEFGHDAALNQDRRNRPLVWDPILDACSAWFAWRMFHASEDEKTILVHLVLERSAALFFRQAHKTMTQYGETSYFEIHATADEEHEKMGLETICNQTGAARERLFLAQQQGWDMMYTIGDQITKIVLEKTKPPKY